MKNVSILILFSLISIGFISAVTLDSSEIIGVVVITPEAKITDTNASTECSGDEVLLGNTTCISILSLGGGGGDITSVIGDNYITNGSASAAVKLVFNETKLNITTNESIIDKVTVAFIKLLGFYDTGEIDSLGNWSADKPNYLNTTDQWGGDLDGTGLTPEVRNNSHLHGCENITGATSDLCTIESSIASNLSEDNVEDYIFDNDNTANLNLTGYNMTGNYIIVHEGYTFFNQTMSITQEDGVWVVAA